MVIFFQTLLVVVGGWMVTFGGVESILIINIIILVFLSLSFLFLMIIPINEADERP